VKTDDNKNNNNNDNDNAPNQEVKID